MLQNMIKDIKEHSIEKSAEDIEIIDVHDRSDITDYLIVMSCSNDRHMKALTNSIEIMLKENFDESPFHVDGKIDSGWTVMDYGNVIIHLFLEDQRDLYQLEDLWMKMKKRDDNGN